MTDFLRRTDVSVDSYNPTTGEMNPTRFDETTAVQVASLCALAQHASEELSERSLTWRAEFLDAIAAALEEDASTIIELANEETALGEARLTGELKRTCFQFRFFAGVVRDGGFLEASIDHATDSPMGPLPDLRRQLEPLGVVGVFGASNFPLAFSVPGGDTASALAAGCSVVIKAHPAHPRTSAATFAAIERAALAVGAPENTVALVFGLEAGVALVDDSRVAAVGFTGSYAAGRALFDRANARAVPIPFYGELGSVNPLVVTPGAAGERALALGEGIVNSVTLGSGQFCTKPGMIFVPTGADGDELVSAAVATLEKGTGATMLSAAIRDRFESGVAKLGDVPNVTHRGRSPRATSSAGSFAALFETDVATLIAQHEGLATEYFGATAVLVRYSSLEELLSGIETLEPALTFTVHVGENDETAPALLALAKKKAGRVIINGFPTGVGVSWSMHHGGPHPASTNSLHTSVGATSIRRWLRPISYQGVPAPWLPAALHDDNPLGIPQRVDGVLRA
jgi:NADP-dependent aldehyde dehydrogenase